MGTSDVLHAVRCSVLLVLQCVAVCCSVLQCAAVHCSVLQCVAVCCSVLQCVAACCNVLQCVHNAREFEQAVLHAARGHGDTCAAHARRAAANLPWVKRMVYY